MTDETTESIWSAGLTDPFWPEPTRTLSGFKQFVASFEAEEAIGWGSIRSVIMNSTIGFVTFHQLDETFVPSGTVVIECGTYLSPNYRGQGLNLVVKRASVTRAFQELGADVVMYAVPVNHRPAIRSLARIVQQGESTQKQLSGRKSDAPNPQFLQKWLRYREWKEGTSFVLFPFSLETAKACDLLDPDGNDRHLAGKQKKPHDNE